MKKEIFTDKYYTHFDVKKHHNDYEKRVKNKSWVAKHGFYPFIHFQMGMDKYTIESEGKKEIKHKEREIYYAAHIDRYIYQYYGNRLNDKYNLYAKKMGINKVSTAYRNCTYGKCNIHFAKEVFEFITRSKSTFVFVGDFSKFFDKLNHKYLKEQLKKVNDGKPLDEADYAIYKNLIHFSFLEAEDIEKEKGQFRREMRELDKYFDTKEFQEFKRKCLHKNKNDYGIPQGSSNSAVYANVYMVEFDKMLNNYITSIGGMYRRYCDDIIIIVPMTATHKQEEKYKNVVKNIFSIKEQTPNLELNADKSEQFFVWDGNVEKIQGKSSLINYLGFTFDGKTVRIRDKSLFKFYCRAYRKIKKIQEVQDEKAFNAGRKAVYQSYTHLGARVHSKDHGNFLTYAYKAHRIFAESDCLQSEIRNQVKRHWKKIDKKLKEKKPYSPSEKEK